MHMVHAEWKTVISSSESVADGKKSQLQEIQMLL